VSDTSDTFDASSASEARFLDECLKFRKPKVTANGLCQSCGEPVLGNQNFCDKDYMDDCQRSKDAKERNK
jgi:hypothetical protein